MKIKYIELNEVYFNEVNYTKELYDSINRIGLSFSIKTVFKNDQYQCIDGHKRLTVLKHLQEIGINKKISMIVVNSEDQRSNDCWNGRNTH